MGRLIVIILVLALSWMIWWAVGATVHERGLRAWLEGSQRSEVQISASEIHVAGFPNRFDTTLTDVEVSSSQTDSNWSLPFIQFLSLAYRPTEVIVALPSNHTLTLNGETYVIRHNQARASVYLEPTTSLPLERATAIVDRLEIVDSFAATELRAASARAPAVANAHRVGIELVDLIWPESIAPATAPLPNKIGVFRLDAELHFNAPLDRFALEIGLPLLTEAKISSAVLSWSDLEVSVSGALSIDASGVPDGALEILVKNWRLALDAARTTDLFAPEALNSTESALTLLAGLDGDVNSLTAPLIFRDGSVFLGPLPLGPAPILH